MPNRGVVLVRITRRGITDYVEMGSLGGNYAARGDIFLFYLYVYIYKYIL